MQRSMNLANFTQAMNFINKEDQEYAMSADLVQSLEIKKDAHDEIVKDVDAVGKSILKEVKKPGGDS